MGSSEEARLTPDERRAVLDEQRPAKVIENVERIIAERVAQALRDGAANTLTVGAIPDKYPLNNPLRMDPSHTHLWTTGEEPDTFRCAECNTIGRLVAAASRFRPDKADS